MEYQGYKLLDKIILVCKDKPEHEDSDYAQLVGNTYQAYLVDPSNKKQLESARNWAKWTEYGPSYKNEAGRWVRDYEIKHSPVEFEFDNNGFTLELLDCAEGSSQGGRLSFWNCLVSKNNQTFKIGINSDMLLDLLKNASFDRGKCHSPLIFITQKGKVGMTIEGSDTYKQCIKDKELKKTMKSTMISKFTFGDLVKTPTINEVYLGTITKYYTFNSDRNTSYSRSGIYCTVTKLAKPITYHVFDSVLRETRISDFLNHYDSSGYAYPDLKRTCPKRFVDGKIALDCSEEDFQKRLTQKIYNYDAFADYAKSSYRASADAILYYYLDQTMFGLGFEPFELPDAIMHKIKAAGIKYVDETK
jgi:hypothetical protein